MKKVIAIATAIFSTILGLPAHSQRTYTFEEACRMAGNTTGACAPRKQQEAENSDSCKRRDQAFGFHSNLVPKTGSATIADVADMEVFVELMGGGINAAEINRLRLVICREPDTANGFAYIDKATNYRILAFDPQWARSINPESYLVIAHEAGHHFCNHDTSANSPRDRELEADRFAGSALKRFEIYHGRRFIDASLAAANRLYSEAGSRSHPPRADRISAIKQGYEAGSPCGNFAPATPGPGIYKR